MSSYLKDLWPTISCLYGIFRPHIGPAKIIVVVLIAAIIPIANYFGWPISNRSIYYATGILISLAIIYVLVKRIREYETPKLKFVLIPPSRWGADVSSQHFQIGVKNCSGVQVKNVQVSLANIRSHKGATPTPLSVLLKAVNTDLYINPGDTLYFSVANSTMFYQGSSNISPKTLFYLHTDTQHHLNIESIKILKIKCSSSESKRVDLFLRIGINKEGHTVFEEHDGSDLVTP